MNARSTGPKHARRLPFAAVVTALVLGGLALLLALNTASAANELRRHALASRDQAIAARVEQLRNEIAASAAPGSLASAAAAFGMVPAANPAFIVKVGGRGGHLVVRGRPLPVPEPVIPLPTHSTAKKKTPDRAKRSQGAAKTSQPATTTTSAAASTSTTAKPAKHTEQSSPTPSTSAAPRPSPTPTPTVTLPGGPR